MPSDILSGEGFEYLIDERKTELSIQLWGRGIRW
tara:strand:- start:26272 stop:26373 length:102 start_codon:yes stop_codon:yes gene_type:complete